MKRIVAELSRRGYLLWFDLENMKGSVMDGATVAFAFHCKMPAQNAILSPLSGLCGCCG